MESIARRSVILCRDGVATPGEDVLAVEEPLELRIGDQPLAITMRTPGHDRDLAAGFLLTEGIIASSEEIEQIEPCDIATYGNVVNVTLAPSAMARRAEAVQNARRQMYLSSSCGLCGKESIDRIHQHVPVPKGDFTVSAAALAQFPDAMRAAQAAFEQTGGIHAAGIFSPTGRVRVLREDVGRHNAVDKALGAMLMLGEVPIDPGVLLVSGRTSFEILQKAAVAGVAFVAGVSAPSSLAVDFAMSMNMTLVGFLRPGRMNIYAGPQRIVRNGE